MRVHGTQQAVLLQPQACLRDLCFFAIVAILRRVAGMRRCQKQGDITQDKNLGYTIWSRAGQGRSEREVFGDYSFE